MADKIDALFSDLQARGFAKDKTIDDFRGYMLAPGAQGYQNRKTFFDDFKSQGMTDLNSYEEFAQLLGLHGTTRNQNNPSGANPTAKVPMQFDLQQAQKMAAGQGPVSWEEPKEPKEETITDKVKRIFGGGATPEETKHIQKKVGQRMDEAAYEQETGQRLRQPVLNPEFEAPTIGRDEFGNVRRDENGNIIQGFTTDEDVAKTHQQIVGDQEYYDSLSDEEKREWKKRINEEIEQLDYKQPTLFESLYKGIGAGVMKAGIGLLNVMDQLTSGMIVEDPSNPSGYIRINDYNPEDTETAIGRGLTSANEYAERISKQAQPNNGEGFVDMLLNGDIKGVVQKGLATAGESLPMTLSWANPYTATLNAISMAGNNFREQTIDNPDIPTWKRASMAIGSAAIEQAVEKYADPFFKYTGGLRFFKKAGAEATEEIVKNVTEKATESLAKRIMHRLGGLAKDAAGEGAEEIFSNVGNDLLGEALDLLDGDKDYGIRAQWEQLKKQNPNADLSDFAYQKAKENIESFIGGALAGFYTSGTTQVSAKALEYSVGKLVSQEEIAQNPDAQIDPMTMEVASSYDDGYNNSQNPSLRKQLNDEAVAAAEVLPNYGDEFAKMVTESENPVETLDYLMNNREYFTDEQIEVAADYFQKKAAADGMMDGVLDQVDTQVEEANAEIRANTHQQTGEVINVLYDGQPYYVIGGDVVIDPDTNAVALVGTGGAVVVKNAETGETSVMSPDNLTVNYAIAAENLITANEVELRQQLMQQAEDDITFGAPANEVYQMEDTVTLADGNGGVIEGQIGMMPNSVDGVYVVYTPDGRALQMTADDMNRRIVAHNGMEVQRESQPVVKDNLTTEQIEQPVEQNQSEIAQNQSEIAQNSGNLDNAAGENAPAEDGGQESNLQQSALSRIPVKVDEKGNPFTNKKGKPILDWHKAKTEDAAAALIETTGGNMLMARDTAADLIKQGQAKLEKIRKQQPKGEDPIEMAESRMEIQRQVEEQQAINKQWSDVNTLIQRQMREEQQRIEEERQAALTEEQRAAEAQRQAEIAAKQAEIDAQRRAEALEKQRKERNKPYAPLQRAKKDLEGYDEAQEVLNDTEPRDLAEWVSYLLRPHSLMWEDEKVGESTVTGLQSELGLQKKDFDRIGTLLGKRSEGALPFAEVVDEIHEGLPEAMKEQFTDQDVRNTLITLFGEGDVNRMLHLAEEHRIEEAQLMKDEMDRRDQEAELDAWADAYHLTPEERESFEAFMQEPPSEPEQEIINQIISEYEQNRTSERVDSQPDNRTAAGTVEAGEGQVQQTVETADEESIEQAPVTSAETAADEQAAADNSVFGERKINTERATKLRADLSNAYASGDIPAIQQAVDAIKAYVDEGGEFDGSYSEAADDYEGTEPDMLTEQYITHLLLDRYLDDDEDQEYIRTGLRKDLRKGLVKFGKVYTSNQGDTPSQVIFEDILVDEKTGEPEYIAIARNPETGNAVRFKIKQKDLQDNLNNGVYVETNEDAPKNLDVKEQQLEFQEPTKSSIQGLENYSEEEIVDTVMNYFDQICADNGADADIVDVKIIGSRVNNNADEKSDLDVLVEYTGNEREDDLFNMLNDAEPLVINGVVVDINPITEGKSGTIQQFLERNADYKKEADKQPQQLGETSSPEEIAAEEAKVNTEPTEGQKKAGNYQMGHIKVDGYDITIENPKGSIRSGVDQNGKAWSQEMHNTYGYIRGTEASDGDHIDVFLSDYPDEGYIYVIDQVNPETGEFDELKIMWGFDSVEDATEAYLSNYEEGWKGLGNINRVERSEFKKWVDSSHRKTKPFAEYKSVKKEEYTEAGEGVKTVDTLDIPAEVKDLVAEEYRITNEILKLPAIPKDEETLNKVNKLRVKLSETIHKLDIALRTLTTKQLLEAKDATKNEATTLYSHVTEEIRNRQIAQQMADTYDAGAEKQGEITGKHNGKPAKQDDYVTTNEKQPALSGVYHDSDGYAVVSDGYVLLADKKAYDKAHKGETLTVGKDAGKKIDGDYPNWKKIARDNTEDYQKAKINVDKLLDFLAGVEDKLKAQWKAEKDAKQTKMSYKDWSSYAEVFVKMPDGSIISFRPQYLKLFAQGMKQIGASEIEYLNIYNKVLATSKNGVSLVMPLARYDTWSQEGDVHRFFYDLSEGKAATKLSWNFNVFENISNNPNEDADYPGKELSLPQDWDWLPENDIDNSYTGQQIKGLNTILRETNEEIDQLEKEGKDATVQRKRREAIEGELDKRKQKQAEWSKRYNIARDGSISLDDLARLFKDLNHNKVLGLLFDRVFEMAKKIGPKVRFDRRIEGAGLSTYSGTINYHFGAATISGRDPQAVAEDILHELIHAVTQSTLSAYKAGGRYAKSLTKSQVKAAKQIEDIYNELKAWAEKNGKADEYFVKNPHEMIAKMGELDIRQMLQSIKTKEKKTLWEWLKDALHGIFSTTRETDMESRLAKALDNLIDNFRRETFEATRSYNNDNEVWTTFKAMEKTLMGVHNIPEYKLRKVLKQGGLANPSLAVVDTKNHIHTDYGEISLIPRSSLIDARKGRNAGTFTADAWTATYPQVMKKMSNKGWDDFYKDTREIQNYEEGGEEMFSKIRMAWDSYLDGRDPSELYWWYLLDRGYKPEAVRYQNEYGAELTKEVTQLATDENGSDIDVSQLPDEAIKRLAELKREYEIQQGEEKKPVEERIAAARASMEGKNEVFRANRQKWIDQLEKYGDTLGNITSWVSKVVWAGRREGMLDVYGTTRQAQKEVQKNHASDYQAWLLEKEGKYGVEEKLFAGTDNYTGRQKWIPNTLANASKLMRKAGLNGAVGWSNLGEWIAKVAKRVTTLPEIRKERKNLNTTREQHDAFKEKWGNILHEISNKIAANGDMWSGEARLTEALEHANPADYIQREYGINLPKKDRAAIDKFIKEVRENFPTGYFETKFQRPVYLNEFAVAVVPDTTSPDVIAALEREGLKITTYQKDQQGNPDDESRKQAVMKAVQDEDDILFRDDDDDEVEPQNDVFYSNAQRAVENVAQEKATPEQWIKMIEKQGGFKAGEDKWLGLRDWLQTAADEGVKTVNKLQILDYIRENQIPVEEVTYREYFDVDDNPTMQKFRKEFDEIVQGMKNQLDELDKEIEDFEDKMYEKYGYGWANELNEEEQEIFDAQNEKYRSDPEEMYDAAFREMVNRHGDDFDLAFQVNYNDGTIDVQEDMYGDGISSAARYFLEFDEQPINDTRLNYTTEGLDNKREIAITVPTIEPYNAGDEIHFGDAGEGRAVVWVRFGDTTVSREPTDEKLADRISKMPTADQWEKVDGSNFVVKKDIYFMPGTRTQTNHSYIVDNGDGTFEISGPMAKRMTTTQFPSLEEAVYAFNKEWVRGRSNSFREKVLVIDEIQSKRHQDAREKGYRDPSILEKSKEALQELIDYRKSLYEKYPELGDMAKLKYYATPEELAKERELTLKANELDNQEFRQRNSVPEAPFEKNWHEVAMKRMLRYAAEHGYDKIAWTTGAQQAERYDLGNVIQEIYTFEPDDYAKEHGEFLNIELVPTGNGEPFFVNVDKDGKIMSSEVDEFIGKNLGEVVGKELAVKLMSAEPGSTIKADDLHIGGEGMKGFYDEILPRFMNKYGKKWGVKVGTVHLPDLEQGAENMWSVDITPEMRESVMEGQPLFRLDDLEVNPRTTGEDMPWEDEEDNPIFYSNALKAVEAIKQDKATPEQWLAMIQKQGGLKAGEDKWIGLTDWLNEQKEAGVKSLNKELLLQYIRSNQIQIDETRYGDTMFSPNSMRNLESEIQNSLQNDGTVEDALRQWDKEFGDTKLQEYQQGRFTVDEKGRIHTDEESMRPIEEVRKTYTTKGLSDKKEIALTVPNIAPYQAHDKVHFGDAGEGRAIAWIRFGETPYWSEEPSVTEARQTLKSLSEKYDGQLVRNPEMTDEEKKLVNKANRTILRGEQGYKRALVIDEIQSKRHQDARDKGYVDNQAVKAYNDWMDNKAKEFGVERYQIEPRLSDEEYREMKRLQEAANGIPEAPFEKNWHELAMKRMLRYAAEHGYDKIAWTTGMQQAERYDIGKVINSIERTRTFADGRVRYDLYPHNNWGISLFVKDGNIISNSSQENLEGKTLAEVVGKELALKMQGMKDGESLDNANLSIGGEGMKGFYDEILPRFLNKYGKRWGVKVEKTSLPKLGFGGQTMWSIDVTPEMRESVLKGQPMFRLREEQPPKKTGIGYKVFVVKDGKLYPPMVANPNGEATPVGEWLDADAAPITGTSKTGRPQVKAGGKGTQGGSGTLAYRPGWHLGAIPYASQFNRKDAKGDKTLFPKDFVWAEVEYADDVDYSEEARQEGMNANGKYQHSLAGLKRVPENGSYRYRTNPDPNTDEWIITGAMKVNRLLTPSEVDQMVRDAGREPQQRQEGSLTDEQVEALNKELDVNNKLERQTQEQEPQQKVEKKRTAAEQRSREAFAERQRRRAVDLAKETVEKLNLGDKVTILDNADGLSGRYKKAKGWYDRSTGKIVIVIDNHKSPSDVLMTILHEGVAHYGLRKLFGKNFDQFLKNVYDHAAFDIKVEIADMAARLRARDHKYGRTIKSNEQYQMDATEEFLAKLAEDTDFERAMNQGWWQQIKQWFIDMLDKIGLSDYFDVELTDNELRYILWRSYQNLAEPGRFKNVFQEAESVYNDAVMRSKLGIHLEKERDRLQQTGKIDTRKVAVEAAEPNVDLFRMSDDAQDIYNEEVAKESLRFAEAWQDSMIGIKAIQDAIAAETGNVATGAEDAYHFENRMHGRAKNMTEQYDWRFYRPMLKIFSDFCNKHNLTQEQGMEYLVAKSGLERNVFYSFRNAMKKKVAEDLQAEREKLEKDYAKGKIAEATYKQMKADLQEKERTGVDDEMQKVKELLVYKRALEDYQNGDIDYTEYLRRIETVINANTGGYYEEAARDFSGLTETFAKAQYDAAQKVKKEAQRAIDPREKRALWSEYDSMMRDAYDQARQVAEDAVFSAEDNIADTNKLWNAINAATKETLKTSYENGLIDRKGYDKVRNMFDFYIPLRGWDENKAADVYTYMGKDNVFSPAVKKTWGRTSKAENPLAYIGNIAVSTILSGHRNMLKQHFLNYVMNNPTNLVSVSESWYENIGTEENPIWILRTADTAGKSADEIAQIVNDFNEEMQQKQAAGLAMPVKGRLRLDVNATKGQKSEHVVEVQRAGHTYQLYINGDPKAAQALNGTNARAVTRFSDTWTGKHLANLNRSMAMFFTSKNPAFVISNLSRDLNMAGASVAINEGPEYNARFIANVARVLTPRLAAGDFSREGIKAVIGKGKGATGLMPKLMSKWMNGKLNEANETERYFKEFMDEGGETGFVNMLSVDSFKEKMKKEIKEMNGSTLLGSSVKETSVGKALRLLGETFEFYNRCAEDATRFIVYMTSRQMGKTLEESIADAKDVTLNFNRKGTGDMGNAEIRDFFIFVNPAIQALANMYRMAKGHPMKFSGVTLGFIVGGVMIPMINKWLINMFGDDDDKEAYWNLPPWVRKNNLVMWIPFTDSFVTIPLAQEFRVFYGIGEMISSYALNHPHNNNGLEVIESLADLVPINPMGNGGNLIVDFTPTGAQPITQLAFNTDFTGKPIWKANQGNKYDPAYTKAYVSTPKGMISISKAINNLTGGNDESQGWLESNQAGAYINNPAVWNHLLQGYFGGMYNTISKTIDAATSLGQGEVPELYRIPVLNRFLNSPAERDNSGALGEQYWNLVDEHDKFMHDLRAWQKREANGDEEAKKYVSDLLKSDEYKRARVIDHYKSLIDTQRKGEKAATEKDDKAFIKQTISMLNDAMMEELAAIDGCKDPMEAAREKFDKAETLAEKQALRRRIENVLQHGEPKSKIKTEDEIVKKALDYRQQNENQSSKADDKYLMLANSSDIEQDAQLKALKKKVKSVTDKYKEMMDDKQFQEAAEYRKQNQKWFTAEKLIGSAENQIRNNKKMLGQGKEYDSPMMKMIRSRRTWILEETKDLQGE